MTYRSFFIYEFLVLWRRKQDVFNALLFFIIVVILFPLGVSAEPAFLAQAASGIIWCGVVLSILISIGHMFKEDYQDGSLEQWIVSSLSLPLLMLLKVMANWVVIIVPLLIMMPLLSEMLFMPNTSFWVLVLTLLVGTPGLFLIGVMGAALTVSVRQGTMLVMLLILPLYLPVLIFATSAVQSAQSGLPYSGLLAMLLALSLMSLVVSPFMTAMAIKASVSG